MGYDLMLFFFVFQTSTEDACLNGRPSLSKTETNVRSLAVPNGPRCAETVLLR
jgi:hypothetical protein